MFSLPLVPRSLLHALRRRTINMRLMRRLENPNAKYLSPFGKLSPTRPAAAVAADSPSLALSLPQRSRSSVSASRRARNDGFNLNILAVVPIAVAGGGRPIAVAVELTDSGWAERRREGGREGGREAKVAVAR